jgi:hypothetical protein
MSVVVSVVSTVVAAVVVSWAASVAMVCGVSSAMVWSVVLVCRARGVRGLGVRGCDAGLV